MRHFLWMLLLSLGGSSSLWAQTPPTVQWQKRFGNRQDSERAFTLLYTSRHRLVVVGEFTAFNNSNYKASALWLLSAAGDSLRQTLYSQRSPINQNITTSYDISSALEATNGDFLLAGTQYLAFQPTTRAENVLLRTDSLGTLKWVRSYPGNAFESIALQPLPDNGALLVAHLLHPLSGPFTPVPVPTIVRVDSMGTVVWQRNYGVPYNRMAAITPLTDGSYAVVGSKGTGPPSWQYGGWVFRINVNGDTLRSRVLGGPLAGFGAVAAAPGGGLVLGGVADQTNALVLVTDSLDRPVWQQRIASPLLNSGPRLSFVRALRQPGQVLVGGTRRLTSTSANSNYLATWQAPAGAGGAATLVWEQQLSALFGTVPTALLVPAGAGRLVGVAQYVPAPVGVYDLRISSFANVPAFYEPPLCRTPPFAAPLLTPVAGSNRFSFSDISLAGPPHAQLLVWRWDFSDGSPPYFGRTPPPRAFAALTPATAVRLTVTNNLGCTDTGVFYPFVLANRPGPGRPAAVLYPNPAGAGAAAVTLAVPGLRAQPPVAGALLNAVGQAVWRGSWPVAALGQGAALGVAGLPPGVYALRLWPQEGPLTLRLVRE